jgi:hypothetical protein
LLSLGYLVSDAFACMFSVRSCFHERLCEYCTSCLETWGNKVLTWFHFHGDREKYCSEAEKDSLLIHNFQQETCLKQRWESQWGFYGNISQIPLVFEQTLHRIDIRNVWS